VPAAPCSVPDASVRFELRHPLPVGVAVGGVVLGAGTVGGVVIGAGCVLVVISGTVVDVVDELDELDDSFAGAAVGELAWLDPWLQAPSTTTATTAVSALRRLAERGSTARPAFCPHPLSPCIVCPLVDPARLRYPTNARGT
jgi:hypothetical protein